MSFTTAVVPVGSMQQWCLAGFDSGPHDPFWDLCRNTTRGHEADFTTICCDGEIINAHLGIWGSSLRDRKAMDLADMVCCRQAGRNPGGLLPLPADYTHCASGDLTPLASMAATNTDNAQNFAVTYISASAGTADWTTMSTPSCLWVDTKSADGTTEKTLPTAKITTLPPESDEVYFTSSAVYSLSASASASLPSASLSAQTAPTRGEGNGDAASSPAASTSGGGPENIAPAATLTGWTQLLPLCTLLDAVLYAVFV